MTPLPSMPVSTTSDERALTAFNSLIGISPFMKELAESIRKVAKGCHPVLIKGETGTGKELVARAIHQAADSRTKPFIPVDCSALAKTLVETELFGHVRGAFTGAVAYREGLLAAAKDGSVFLDEIGDMPLELQTRLLRAIQEREFRPVGSTSVIRLGARVIAATNCNLEAAVRAGTFRQDLYFRLNVLTIDVPPLRDRKEDIPILVQHFLDKHSGKIGTKDVRPIVSVRALNHLLAYDWPGNVRELENCIQRALILKSGDALFLKDVAPWLTLSSLQAPTGAGAVIPLHELERRAIVDALKATGGDKRLAARMLEIGATTLYRKLKDYGKRF
jgi:two-component system, NtrC family, response regulator AtoC